MHCTVIRGVVSAALVLLLATPVTAASAEGARSEVAGAVPTATLGKPSFILPFEEEASVKTSGPHTWAGTADGARGSVDFGLADTTDRMDVVAAAAGVATVHDDLGWSRCYVLVDHGNGWQTAYYHLVDVPAGLDGTSVQQGQRIGEMGAVGVDTCGSGTPGYRHVHVVLLKDWQETPVDGTSFGGYTVHEAGEHPYCGYWTRDSDGKRVTESLTTVPATEHSHERCPPMDDPLLTNDGGRVDQP